MAKKLTNWVGSEPLPIDAEIRCASCGWTVAVLVAGRWRTKTGLPITVDDGSTWGRDVVSPELPPLRCDPSQIGSGNSRRVGCGELAVDDSARYRLTVVDPRRTITVRAKVAIS